MFCSFWKSPLIMVLSLNLNSSWLSFFHKTWPPEELLKHKTVNYFFMPNFHDVMSNPWSVCQKDMSEGQKWYQKSKVRLQLKGLFRTIPNTLFDQNILWNYFLNCFSYKVWEKKSLKVKKFVLRKRLKNKQIVILMHHFVLKAFGTIWKQAICQKDQIWCKITFLHENTTFIATFAMGFIKKLEIWDSTAMTTYFITDPFTVKAICLIC